MDVKICLLVFCLVLAVGKLNAQVSYKGGNCPLKNSVTTCMPRCTTDYQCSFNKKCCPNKCGTMSCASSSSVSTGSDGGYKGSNNGEPVNCDGVKCGPYEKCEFDRSTKRKKCVRT